VLEDPEFTGTLSAVKRIWQQWKKARGIRPEDVAIPVETEVTVTERLPPAVESAAYYVVSEALTNAAKHADASVVYVDVRLLDGSLRLAVRDDGAGGADPANGSGLIGLTDRVQALGGTLTVDSPAGQGTTLQVSLPVAPEEISS